MMFRGWRITQSKSVAVGVALLLAAMQFSGCSERESAGGTSTDAGIYAVTNKTIAGVSQKGPMRTGSTVVLEETDGPNLVSTDRIFVGTVRNNDGEFRIDGVSLRSPYALLSAEGYYKHDVDENDDFPRVKLNAIFNVEKRDEVNINILTHFTYGRILALAKKGLDFETAKKQADREIANAFGFGELLVNPEELNIFSGSNGDNGLLALSVIVDNVNISLLGNLAQHAWLTEYHPEFQYCRGGCHFYDEKGNEVSFDESTSMQMLLDDIASEFAEYGKMSGPMIDVLAYSAVSFLGNHVHVSMKDSVVDREEKEYEKYISSFVGYAYGLGDCDAEKDGVMYELGRASESHKIFSCETNQDSMDFGYAEVLACKNGYWMVKSFRCDTNDFWESDEVDYVEE